MEILPICRDLEILYVDVWWSYDMYILEMYDLYRQWLLKNFIYACYLKFVEDVAVGTKGVSQNHLLSFDNNKVLKIINWIC